jgi:hypothetical protein
MSSADSTSFELKDVVTTLTLLTEAMQKMAIQFGAVEEKVNKIERKTQALTEPNSEDSYSNLQYQKTSLVPLTHLVRSFSYITFMKGASE